MLLPSPDELSGRAHFILLLALICLLCACGIGAALFAGGGMEAVVSALGAP